MNLNTHAAAQPRRLDQALRRQLEPHVPSDQSDPADPSDALPRPAIDGKVAPRVSSNAAKVSHLSAFSSRLFPMFRLFLLAAGALVALGPFLWMLLTALSPAEQMYAYPPRWPWPLQWSNFIEVWRAAPFGRFFLNTAVVTSAVVVLRVSVSTLCAFALARLRFRGSEWLLFLLLLGVLVPGELRLAPSFVLLRALGWLDTYAGLIVPRIENPLLVLLLRQFFLTLPRDLEDAARLDGCGALRVLWHVVVPLSKPVLALAALMTFQALWNDFTWPLLMTSSTEMKPLQVGLALLSDQHRHTQLNLLMAATVMSVAPVLLVFYAAQRWFLPNLAWSGLR
ncbi:MAG: carbohydrate ABC transporter permease [Candidatus Hydrogenedentes bacterium]|nr:carbohydrate ABC transporter permease [Candidatus Hydrogenedentota bacterium]